MNRTPAPRRALTRLLSSSTALALLLLLPACSGGKAEGRRYELKGRVVSVDRAKGEVSVEHGKVEDFMPAMTMAFPLRDADALKVVEPGDGIQAALVVADDSYWLESPVISKGLPAAPASPAQGTGPREPEPGAEVPEVKLVNQDGRPFNTRSLRGRALVVTFIYTRCPLPDQCPLLSANFAQLNAALAADPELRKRARLLSVTLDPEHDRPEVLRDYGAAYAGGRFDDWDFATGDPAEVRRLAESFGLVYKAEGGQVVHSLRTAVVTPDGKVFKVYRGNEWKPEEVLKDLRSLPAS
ncbi:MAG TPA: SCO family protein [Pyrinomonadaceae bacterium]|jgi:protein SCO1/2